MVPQIGSSSILIIGPRDILCQISYFWVYPVSPFLKNGKNMALYGQNMVLIWSLKLVLPESLSICQGMFHAKFHIAGCSFQPLFLHMAKTWPFYGQNIVLTWSLKLVLFQFQLICSGMFHAKFHIAGCILQPIFLEMAKYGPFIGKTWSSHVP